MAFYQTQPAEGLKTNRVWAMRELHIPTLLDITTPPELTEPAIGFYSGSLYVWDGAAWVPVGSGGPGTTPTLQQVADEGNLSTTPIILTSIDGALDPAEAAQLEVNNTAGGGLAAILMRTVNNTTAEGTYVGAVASNFTYTTGGPGGGTFTGGSLTFRSAINGVPVDMLKLYPGYPYPAPGGGGLFNAQAIFNGPIQISAGTENNHAITRAQLDAKPTIYTADGTIGTESAAVTRKVRLGTGTVLQIAPTTATDPDAGAKFTSSGNLYVKGQIGVNTESPENDLHVHGTTKIDGRRTSGFPVQPTTLEVDGVTNSKLFNLSGVADADQLTELITNLDSEVNFFIYNGSDVSGTGTVIGSAAGDNTPTTLTISAKSFKFVANDTPRGFEVSENNFKITSSETNIGGAVTLPIIKTTSDITLDNTHYTVVLDTAAANLTVSLPLASTCQGRIYVVKNAGVNVVNINAAGSDQIDAEGSGITVGIGQQPVTIQSDGLGVWVILAGYY